MWVITCRITEHQTTYTLFSDVLPRALALAQRAFAAAAIFARAAALILRTAFLGVFADCPFCLAHLALCAAAILARAAALILPGPRLAAVFAGAAEDIVILASWVFSFSI